MKLAANMLLGVFVAVALSTPASTSLADPKLVHITPLGGDGEVGGGVAWAIDDIGKFVAKAHFVDHWDDQQLLQSDLDARCTNDSLNIDEAKGRVEWSIQHYPVTVAEFYSYITSASKDYATKLGSLEETKEMARREWLLLPNGKPLDRPKYPLWGFGVGAESQVWRAPIDPNGPADKPDNVSIRAVCRSSCYKPEVRLLYGGGYMPIQEALETRAPDIVTLANDATLEALRFVVGSVHRYAIEVNDAQHRITVILTSSGGKLEVTGNHPLVDGEGYMREASTFKPGDKLSRADGSRDEIVRVTTEDFFGKVYNVTPKSKSLLGHIVIAEGFLSGSAWYQNEGAEYLNRDIFRMNLPDELVE